jgi:hypothetical protein
MLRFTSLMISIRSNLSMLGLLLGFLLYSSNANGVMFPIGHCLIFQLLLVLHLLAGAQGAFHLATVDEVKDAGRSHSHLLQLLTSNFVLYHIRKLS